MTIVQWLFSILLGAVVGFSLLSGHDFIVANRAFLAFLAGLFPIVYLYAYIYIWRYFSPESYRAALFKTILALDKVIAERKKAAHDKAASDSDVSDGERFYD